MSQEDQARWDRKWAERVGQSFEPRPLLVHHRALLSGGRALDLACGPGHDSLWLAEQGYLVLGVDVSLVAIQAAQLAAQERGLLERAHFLHADLNHWRPGDARFELVCLFRFLERSLLPLISGWVAPGGLLFCETRHAGWRSSHPDAPLRYLLRRGELAGAFAGWQIIHDVETAAEAQLIARKPG
jgi:tellurite methyltransferase